MNTSVNMKQSLRRMHLYIYICSLYKLLPITLAIQNSNK